MIGFVRRNKGVLAVFSCLFFLLISCKEREGTSAKADQKDLDFPIESKETLEMAQILQKLVTEGKPEYLYHWNAKLAESFREKMEKAGNQKQYIEYWYQYISQLLNSGKSEASARIIETTLEQWGMTYEAVLDRGWSPILDVLALAYLRLGEQENCMANHNPQVCIVPFEPLAVHTLEKGSRKAIAIYTLLYRRYGRDSHKWLINLAYMTLGEHPQQVPEYLLIPFPNWDREKKNFPKFLNKAPSLGVAVNGLSGGVCLDDFNNDGFIDIFATSYGMEDKVSYFINTGKGSFSDRSETSGINGIVSGLNCLHADYDNDGDKDILILRGGWLRKGGEQPNSLLRNNGDGTFDDVTRSSGILSYRPTQTAAWADVNKDGFLDLFIGNEYVKGEGAHPCELFINQGDGTFREKATEHGLGGIKKYVKGVAFGDIDTDLWPDLYVSVMGG
ncbi:MAG: VCBS repeat-containing protein, partial [Bacteroidota bacterium]